MSQEEIEALMNGVGDFGDDAADETKTDNTDNNEANDESIDDILAGIDGVEDDTPEESTEENFDDILAGIDGITDSDVSENEPETKEPEKEGGTKVDIEELIDQSQYPMPVKQENKVVNQLNQVADDSEQKASQIFDVLSFILDENNEISNYNKQMGEFIKSQEELLSALSVKFPNIDVFQTNLEAAKNLSSSTEKLSEKLDGENMKIFEAMELMQFHDINRQKIERVMAVIRKLNDYLNGIFEDDSVKPEVQIAKHISGDANDIVDAGDIESLISEFSKG
jgi:hypothetical protein